MIEDNISIALQSRLHLIIENVSRFWEHSHHGHFTFHDRSHSIIVYEKLENLVQRLPKDKTVLTEDELFIVSSAAWLYEIGMQCTNLKPTLNINWRSGITLSPDQLKQIRDKKHELTQRMILDSVHPDHDGARIQLGLQDDDYTVAIAAVCRWCSNEPLENVPETMLVNDKRIRLRLLVALLRLADQLYIGYSRVDVALLQNAYLSPREKARWWAYHHTATLSIGENMLIPFHYYLSEEYKPLLNHIRTLIEPDFRRTNPVIKYLWDTYGLTLTPQNEPGVDPPSGARQPMTEEMRAIVRSIKVDEEIQQAGMGYSKESVKENSLLVLDYENFLFELGLEGYFPTLEQIKSMLFTLFKEARSRHIGFVTGLAAAHWDRPDLRPIADMLEEVELYELLKVEDHQKGSEVLLLELQNRLQNSELPGYVILVAPQMKMIRIAKKFHEAKQLFSAWLNNTPDVGAYHSLADQFPQLADILELSDAQKVDTVEQDIMQMACILRLEDRMVVDQYGTSFREVSSALKQVGLISGRVDWWQLNLIHLDILRPLYGPNGYVLTFNSTHPRVDLVRRKRNAIIGALQSLKPEGTGVPENLLINELVRHPAFQNDEGGIVRFLELLQDEAIVSVDRHPSDNSGQSLWQLNIAHRTVVAFNAGRYLPLFVLGFDHAMVRSGYPTLHEHTLKNRLKSYMENNAAEAAYQLALERKWLNRKDARPQDKQYFRNEHLVDVELMTEREEVQKILLSRDILFDILRIATYRGGLQRDALKHTLGRNHRFTLKLDEVDSWLSAFQREALIIVDREQDATDIECDCIKLNFDTQLLQYLLGRMYVYGVVMAMRILRATTPETGKSAEEIIEMLANRVTYGNRQLATWAFEYAKHIRLVGLPKFDVPSAVQNALSLQKHRVVQRLDNREFAVSQALTALVERLSRPHIDDGWVPMHVVIQRMEQDPQQFGYTHGEYHFWINRTAIRYRTLKIEGRAPQIFIRPTAQERH
jgi:hypothetical protein